MPDGQMPSSGGWNHFILEVDNIASLVTGLRSQGVKFRHEITKGPGGSQILCENLSDNDIELFQAP